MAQGLMDEATAIIAGGGIAGLATALALAPAPVVVLERAPFFEQVGAGLQLGPNAIRALRHIGAWDAVEPCTSSPPEIHIWDGFAGKRLKRIPLGTRFEQRYGAPYRLALRADVHGALLSLAQQGKSIAIRTGIEVAAMRDKVTEIEVIAADGTELQGKLLLACDGVNSMLRQQAFPGSAACDSGLTLHRALLRSWPGEASIAWDCINLWLCPGAHVVHYPVGHAGRLNVVATTANGVTPAAAHSRSATALQNLLSSNAAWLPWPGLYVPPLSSWRSGNLLLLGDAAHGTLPFLAQGAAMALEDAADLKDCNPLDGATWQAADVRRRRTRRLHDETLRMKAFYHASGMRAALRNLIFRSLPPDRFRGRQDWIYDGWRPQPVRPPQT